MAETGCLILVVGPSGSGKDTLLNLARQHFDNDPNIIFPKRLITRPIDAGGEDHEPVNRRQFRQLLAAGQIAFHWEAHGLLYGIRKNIDQKLMQSSTVIVNVSRTVCERVSVIYDRVRIISISVQRDALAKRLYDRGRETKEDIQQRLDRADQYCVTGENVTTIDNSGDLDVAKSAFIQIITSELQPYHLKENA